jgi:membrane protein YqaA with SNARE-associated domain
MKKAKKKIEKKIKVSPADVFMHLLATILLYASAISFLVLVFQLVNVNYPDILDQNTYSYYFLEQVYSLMRGALAFLIIAYPVYLLSFWRLKKNYQKNPEKLELHIRKWLVYLTLFTTALLIIGNLIALLAGFLHGDLTLRFIFKIISVFFVAGSIFSYYIFDLKNRYTTAMRLLIIFVSLIIIAAVVSGFFFVGSPSEQRLRRIDEQKIQSLQTIQMDIETYWQLNKKLPRALSELKGSKYTSSNLVDPQTNKAYEYKAIDEKHYQVCAEFNLSSYNWDYSQKYGQALLNYSWGHPSGKYCFDLQPDVAATIEY